MYHLSRTSVNCRRTVCTVKNSKDNRYRQQKIMAAAPWTCMDMHSAPYIQKGRGPSSAAAPLFPLSFTWKTSVSHRVSVPLLSHFPGRHRPWIPGACWNYSPQHTSRFPDRHGPHSKYYPHTISSYPFPWQRHNTCCAAGYVYSYNCMEGLQCIRRGLFRTHGR